MSQPVRELQVTPWDALLASVRLAAGRVEWTDQQLTDQVRACDGDMNDVRVLRWLRESRLERSLLAKSAKAAVDAGVAERLVRQTELESSIIVRVLGRTLDDLGLALAQAGLGEGAVADLRVRAHSVVHRELLEIEARPEALDEERDGGDPTHPRG
jgi:hypothetical protein